MISIDPERYCEVVHALIWSSSALWAKISSGSYLQDYKIQRLLSVIQSVSLCWTFRSVSLFCVLCLLWMSGELLEINNQFRCIIHIDLDAFYCQVEQVRLGIDPKTPLGVQQWSGLIAINYPARAAGIYIYVCYKETCWRYQEDCTVESFPLWLNILSLLTNII